MDTDAFQHLLGRVQAGEPAALNELLSEYGGFVRAAVRRKLHQRLRSQYDSLDFVQDIWASLLMLPPERYRFETPEALVAFLGRVANNKVTDVFRKRFNTKKHAITREESLADAVETNEMDVEGSESTPSMVAMAAEQWEALLAELPPGHRPILEKLRDGYEYEQIAQEAGVSLSTVNRVVRRLKRLSGLSP